MNNSVNNICEIERCGPTAKYVCLDNLDPKDPQAGTKLDCYYQPPTLNECSKTFDLSACTNIDCKVGCNPHSNPPGLCPAPGPGLSPSPCPDTGCCDRRPGPRPKPISDPTLKQCVDALSCQTDPLYNNYYDYKCSYNERLSGNCTDRDYCQSIINDFWPLEGIDIDGSGVFPEIDDKGNLNCPIFNQTWDDDSWDEWKKLADPIAYAGYGRGVPAELCKKANPDHFKSHIRCKFADGDFKDTIGACMYDEDKDPQGNQAQCKPVINNCADCNNNEMVSICQKKFPDEIGFRC